GYAHFLFSRRDSLARRIRKGRGRETPVWFLPATSPPVSFLRGSFLMAVLQGCPSSEHLRQLVAGEAPPEELQEFADHLELCGWCVEQLENLEAYCKQVAAVRQGVQAAPKYWAEDPSTPPPQTGEQTIDGIGHPPPALAEAVA